MEYRIGSDGTGTIPTGGRIEDARLLTGRGRYLADLVPKGALRAVFLRADRASARIDRLDVAAARAMPGVADVLTAATLSEAGLGALPAQPLQRDDTGVPQAFPVPLLAATGVRHVGEPLAMILAETGEAALDAAEAIAVGLDDVPFEAGIAFLRRRGDASAVRAALARAAHQVTVDVSVPRLHAAPLETRGIVALPEGGGLRVHTSTQNPFAIRRGLSAVLGIAEPLIRVEAPEVGGSFGQKGFLTREEALVAFAALRLGRPVAWVATRSEGFAADHQGRGVSGRVTLGLDAALGFAAIEAAFEVDAGAYPGRGALGMINNSAGITGVYHVPAAAVEIVGRLSPRAPLAPYRGNGRPEATLAIEQAIDAAARALGADPLDLRRRNLIRPADLPCRTALGFPFETGDFPRVFDAAAQGAAPQERAARRREAEGRGRLYGFGFAACVESSAGPVGKPRPDHARITVLPDGRLRLAAGVMSAGQGHETALIRMAAARLGLPPDRFLYVNGDTGASADGRGSGGSSGLGVAGAAMHEALGRLVDEGARLAARRFGRSERDVAYQAGVFSVAGTNLSADFADLAGAEGGWVVDAEFSPDEATFPNGAHACEVEIDPDTGAVEIMRYRAVEDIGRVLNPDLVEGQLHGGIAMGVAQVLGEEMRHDDAGQVLTGTLMDYALLRAGDCPRPDLDTVQIPSGRNPLGVKGVGEAGTVGATAALMSAVCDALHSAGVQGFDMPATPARVWQALNRRARQ